MADSGPTRGTKFPSRRAVIYHRLRAPTAGKTVLPVLMVATVATRHFNVLESESSNLNVLPLRTIRLMPQSVEKDSFPPKGFPPEYTT